MSPDHAANRGGDGQDPRQYEHVPEWPAMLAEDPRIADIIEDRPGTHPLHAVPRFRNDRHEVVDHDERDRHPTAMPR